jgi:WD40 repeat protein
MENKNDGKTENKNDKILCIRFNSSNTLFAVGDNKSFRIYNVNKHIPLVNRKFEFGVKIIELLDTSNIIGIVGYTTPTILYIWNEASGSIVGKIDLEKIICDIKLTKNYCCVIFNDSIKLYKINKLEEIKSFNKDPLYIGNIFMSEKYLIYPSDNIGYINIYNLQDNTEVNISAHQNNIANFGVTNNYICSVSKMGTLIRIFDIDTKKIVKEYRRGICNSILYSCLISNDNKYLVTTGDTGTIHLYNLMDENQNTKSLLGTFGFILPEYFSSTWSFVKFYNYENIAKPHITCFDNTNSNHIFIITYDGTFIKYNIDPKNKLINQYDEFTFI